ncbi:hypothetical protein N0M98_11435 [Paenibacillus doosanensis]|uniref:Lipoprotein n=1 Tax=Paenibacillus konkukensis TaxID=2020716 RepID=A0ABY4RUP6_9BACL|nr:MULTISPECIES: hypothetical protein [Paenibacillus]MCS7460757.1 hypothetical protein [Paenibacillus doosanensis]UQZ85938.1 hypothetical protein SK3146_05228 [Paenibacillus konkukensis]
MRRKQRIITILALMLMAMPLAACVKQEAGTPNSGNTASTASDPGAKPATLEGESLHWKVKVDYAPQNNKLQEIASVAYKVDELIDNVNVTVVHGSGTPLANAVIEPTLLKPGQFVTLDKKGTVTSWKDTTQVEIEWKSSDNQVLKEYITVKNKAEKASS